MFEESLKNDDECDNEEERIGSFNSNINKYKKKGSRGEEGVNVIDKDIKKYRSYIDPVVGDTDKMEKIFTKVHQTLMGRCGFSSEDDDYKGVKARADGVYEYESRKKGNTEESATCRIDKDNIIGSRGEEGTNAIDKKYSKYINVLGGDSEKLEKIFTKDDKLMGRSGYSTEDNESKEGVNDAVDDDSENKKIDKNVGRTNFNINMFNMNILRGSRGEDGTNAIDKKCCKYINALVGDSDKIEKIFTKDDQKLMGRSGYSLEDNGVPELFHRIRTFKWTFETFWCFINIVKRLFTIGNLPRFYIDKDGNIMEVVMSYNNNKLLIYGRNASLGVNIDEYEILLHINLASIMEYFGTNRMDGSGTLAVTSYQITPVTSAPNNELPITKCIDNMDLSLCLYGSLNTPGVDNCEFKADDKVIGMTTNEDGTRLNYLKSLLIGENAGQRGNQEGAKETSSRDNKNKVLTKSSKRLDRKTSHGESSHLSFQSMKRNTADDVPANGSECKEVSNLKQSEGKSCIKRSKKKTLNNDSKNGEERIDGLHLGRSTKQDCHAAEPLLDSVEEDTLLSLPPEIVDNPTSQARKTRSIDTQTESSNEPDLQLQHGDTEGTEYFNHLPDSGNDELLHDLDTINEENIYTISISGNNQFVEVGDIIENESMVTILEHRDSGSFMQQVWDTIYHGL